MNDREPERTIYRFNATPAVRSAFKLRAGFCGASGSGKSFSALAVASRIAERLSAPLYAIDSENGSLLKYAKSKRTGKGFDFMHVPLPPLDFSPAAYSAAIDYCIGEGAGVILIDSFSHEWEGPNGVLEQVDAITEHASRNGKQASSFSSGWKDMKPEHNRLVQKMLSCDAHLIFTVRAKVKYKMVDKKPQKDGEGPVQNPGIEYEPDLFFWMADSVLTVDKTRCDSLAPLATYERPGADFADILVAWIEDVEDPIDAMIAAAIAKGLAAFHAKDHDRWKLERANLVRWMEAQKVPQARGREAMAKYNADTRPGYVALAETAT